MRLPCRRVVQPGAHVCVFPLREAARSRGWISVVGKRRRRWVECRSAGDGSPHAGSACGRRSRNRERLSARRRLRRRPSGSGRRFLASGPNRCGRGNRRNVHERGRRRGRHHRRRKRRRFRRQRFLRWSCDGRGWWLLERSEALRQHLPTTVADRRLRPDGLRPLPLLGSSERLHHVSQGRVRFRLPVGLHEDRERLRGQLRQRRLGRRGQLQSGDLPAELHQRLRSRVLHLRGKVRLPGDSLRGVDLRLRTRPRLGRSVCELGLAPV